MAKEEDVVFENDNYYFAVCPLHGAARSEDGCFLALEMGSHHLAPSDPNCKYLELQKADVEHLIKTLIKASDPI